MTPVIALSHSPMMKCQHGKDPSLEVMTSQYVIVWLKSIDSLLLLQDETMADLQATCNACVFFSSNMLLYDLQNWCIHIWHPNELIGTQCATFIVRYKITLWSYSTHRNPLFFPRLPKHWNEKKKRKIYVFLEHPRHTQTPVKKKYTSILLKRILMNMLKYKFNAMFSHT